MFIILLIIPISQGGLVVADSATMTNAPTPFEDYPTLINNPQIGNLTIVIIFSFFYLFYFQVSALPFQVTTVL